MPVTDIIKLAPTLTAEERFKLMGPEYHRLSEGESQMFSDSEIQAITHFENRAAWEVYTKKLNILQWANVFITRDIETEKLRVLCFYSMLSHQLEKIVREVNQPMNLREVYYEELHDHILQFNEQSTHFYSIRDAIQELEQDLCGVPLFNEKKRQEIASYYEHCDELLENYNARIRILGENKKISPHFKPFAEHRQKYLAQKPMASEALIENIVNEVRTTAEAETRMLGR